MKLDKTTSVDTPDFVAFALSPEPGIALSSSNEGVRVSECVDVLDPGPIELRSGVMAIRCRQHGHQEKSQEHKNVLLQMQRHSGEHYW